MSSPATDVFQADPGDPFEGFSNVSLEQIGEGFSKAVFEDGGVFQSLVPPIREFLPGLLERSKRVLEAFLESVRERGQRVMQDLGCVLRKSLLPARSLGESI